jgi:hypothetical protein
MNSILELPDAGSEPASTALPPSAIAPNVEEPELLPPLEQMPVGASSASTTARSRLEQGHRLASRGATAAAREEFVATLAAVADARDHATGTSGYSQLLQRGLLHLEELRDFFPGGTMPATSGTASIVEAHGSGLVPAVRAAGLARPAACDVYQRAIAERLGEICRLDPVASEACACIAKLHALRQATGCETAEYDLRVAVLLNEIALRCEPNNPRYANELGVLYAMQGNDDASRDMFVRSLRQRQTVEVWSNLAQLHQRRSETRLAELAAGEARRLADHLAANGNGGRVRWVSPAEFGGQPEPDLGAPDGDRTASRAAGEPDSSLRR